MASVPHGIQHSLHVGGLDRQAQAQRNVGCNLSSLLSLVSASKFQEPLRKWSIYSIAGNALIFSVPARLLAPRYGSVGTLLILPQEIIQQHAFPAFNNCPSSCSPGWISQQSAQRCDSVAGALRLAP